MSLVKNAVDPTKGDLDKFEIRRRIRSYVKNGPKERVNPFSTVGPYMGHKNI